MLVRSLLAVLPLLLACGCASAETGTLRTGVNTGAYGPSPSGGRVTDEVSAGRVALFRGGLVRQDPTARARPVGEPYRVLEAQPGERATVRLQPGTWTIARTDGTCGHEVHIAKGTTVTDDLRFGTLYC